MDSGPRPPCAFWVILARPGRSTSSSSVPARGHPPAVGAWSRAKRPSSRRRVQPRGDRLGGPGILPPLRRGLPSSPPRCRRPGRAIRARPRPPDHSNAADCVAPTHPGRSWRGATPGPDRWLFRCFYSLLLYPSSEGARRSGPFHSGRQALEVDHNPPTGWLAEAKRSEAWSWCSRGGRAGLLMDSKETIRVAASITC